MVRPQPTRSTGFTLVELIIAVSIIAILALIAIPNLLSARLNANETAAMSSVRNVWTGAAQFQTSARIDLDLDGGGEHGFLREMSGLVGMRMTADGSLVEPQPKNAVIPSGFRNIDAAGGVSRTGYRFQLILPDANGNGVHERRVGPYTGSIGTDLAENTFCIYAWPSRFSYTGNRTFFVNEEGDVIQTTDTRYTGANMYTLPFAGAAFRGTGPLTSITGDPAVGTVGRDGNLWRKLD